MMHACRMLSVKIEGDKALACMPRGEEHRLKNGMLTRENICSVFSTAMHYIFARREDGRWKMYNYRIEPLSQQIPVGENCLEYHEYLMGGGENERQ